jgi:hypothetical protein
MAQSKRVRSKTPVRRKTPARRNTPARRKTPAPARLWSIQLWSIYLIQSCGMHFIIESIGCCVGCCVDNSDCKHLVYVSEALVMLYLKAQSLHPSFWTMVSITAIMILYVRWYYLTYDGYYTCRYTAMLNYITTSHDNGDTAKECMDNYSMYMNTMHKSLNLLVHLCLFTSVHFVHFVHFMKPDSKPDSKSARIKSKTTPT